jgi:hypothetical protein
MRGSGDLPVFKARKEWAAVDPTNPQGQDPSVWEQAVYSMGWRLSGSFPPRRPALWPSSDLQGVNINATVSFTAPRPSPSPRW